MKHLGAVFFNYKPSFMTGLDFGRLLSLLIDGTPTFGYLLGNFAKLFLGFYGLWLLKTGLI